MSTTCKSLIDAQFVLSAGSTMYTAPSGKAAIIDKFTVTNTDDSSAHTVTVSLVKKGGVQSQANQVIRSFSVGTDTCKDFTEIQNHILNSGDAIYIAGAVDSKLVVRASGREVTT